MTTAPVLTTSRTILRPHRIADFEDVAAMWADRNVVRYISGQPSTREQSWGRLLRYAGHWQMLGFGYWVVVDRTNGAFLGEVGLADYQRDIEPSFDGAPEAGWVMTTASHGKGLAREAVKCALAWSDANLKSRHMVCMISPEHEASLRLAAAMGFHVERTARYGGEDVLILRRDQPS